MDFHFDLPPTSSKPKKSRISIKQLSSFRRSSSPNPSPPAYTTDDIFAAKYQKFASFISWVRIAITLISFATSIVIVACVGHALRLYSHTHQTAGTILPLWPMSVDLRPSHAVLGCGIIILVFSLVYVGAAVLPSKYSKLHRLNLASTFLSLLSLFVAVFTTAYAVTISNDLSGAITAGTLTSWTCKWEDFSNNSPTHFMTICTESTVALDLVMFMIVLEVLSVAVTGWGWIVEKRLKKMEGTGDKGLGIA